ncbi:MAG: hypothetical protein KDD47_01330 [Acidobacteria bacterium]|nr:hypothetical protein [Acidobacteriota bacterium]
MSQQIELTAESFAPPKDLNRIQKIALMVGVAGFVVALIGLFRGEAARGQFFQSYLVSYLFWLSISLGSLGLLALQHMTQGAWGLVPRRINEASSGVLVLMAALFVPIWLGRHELFEWLHPLEHHDEVLEAKLWYLNAPFYAKRVILYFLLWIGMTWLLTRFSSQQDRKAHDEAASARIIARMRQVAAPGLVVLAVLATFSSVDLLMSLDPHWYSSLYGIYFMGSQLIAGMTFLILVCTWLSRFAPMNQVLSPKIFHAQGKLLMAFTLLWAYFGVSQFLITWSGDLPEEILWYKHRQEHGWQFVALTLVFAHFAIPFLLLLSRPRKEAAGRLAKVALLLLAAHWLDYFWQAAPTFDAHLSFHPQYVATLAAVGGLWLWLFVTLLKRRPILPVKDPYLPEALADESH